MTKKNLCQAWIDDAELKRLEELARKAAMSKAQVIRSLINNAKALEIIITK